MKNKKALSEMIAYVLLIVIAVSISIIVYAYLRAYIITEKETCPETLSLIISSYSCNAEAKTLNITLKNQGLHSIDGFIIHGNNETNKGFSLTRTGSMEKGDIFFSSPLNSSQSENFIFSYIEYNSINQVEIKPLKQEKNLLICEEAIISQQLSGC